MARTHPGQLLLPLLLLASVAAAVASVAAGVAGAAGGVCGSLEIRELRALEPVPSACITARCGDPHRL